MQQGKALKSAPAYVKEHHAEEWKDLQRTVKDMEKMLSAHRRRIERLLLTQRAISIETLRNLLSRPSACWPICPAG